MQNICRKRATTSQQRMKWDDLSIDTVQNLALHSINVLFTYAAMEMEVNTDPIVDYLLFRNPGLQVAYPVYVNLKAIP